MSRGSRQPVCEGRSLCKARRDLQPSAFAIEPAPDANEHGWPYAINGAHVHFCPLCGRPLSHRDYHNAILRRH